VFSSGLVNVIVSGLVARVVSEEDSQRSGEKSPAGTAPFS
jgi:hypothetical protein